MTERQKIIDWLKRESCARGYRRESRLLLSAVADMIEMGPHLKKPEPTIPVKEWIDKPSAG